MATRAQLNAVAQQYNATLEIEHQYGRYEAWAPEGRVWVGNNCQMIVVDYGYAGESAAAYDHLISEMEWNGHIDAP